MERFLFRSQSPAPSNAAVLSEVTDSCPAILDDPSEVDGSQRAMSVVATDVVTVAVLDLKLQSLLQNLTHNITKEVGKITQELRKEIDQLGQRTDTLENKFDELTSM